MPANRPCTFTPDRAGESYVVFGGSDVGSTGTLALSSLNGINGFALTGKAAGDQSGRPVSGAGDINGDGIDDLIIGRLTQTLMGKVEQARATWCSALCPIPSSQRSLLPLNRNKPTS